MADLLVGSIAVEKGIEYAGIFPNANAIRVFDKTKISVNRTPYLGTVNNELIKIHPSYSYDFESDSIIGLYSTVNDNLERVEENTDTRTLTLPRAINRNIVEVIHKGKTIPIGKGIASGSAMVENTSKHKVTVTVKLIHMAGAGGVEFIIASSVVQILRKSKKIIGISNICLLDILDLQTLKLTIEADRDGCTVEGGVNPSIVRITETI